jgi:hypothetical protein
VLYLKTGLNKRVNALTLALLVCVGALSHRDQVRPALYVLLGLSYCELLEAT